MKIANKIINHNFLLEEEAKSELTKVQKTARTMIIGGLAMPYLFSYMMTGSIEVFTDSWAGRLLLIYTFVSALIAAFINSD